MATLFSVNPVLLIARAGFIFYENVVSKITLGYRVIKTTYFIFKLIYAEFLPALIIPKEQRMASFSYTSFTGVLTSCSSSSLILVRAYC